MSLGELCNLVLSTGLIKWTGHRKKIRKLTFRALALRRSESIRSDEGLTLETSASGSLYGGQVTLSTQLIKPNYLVILPPPQHHSFFRWTLFGKKDHNSLASVFFFKKYVIPHAFIVVCLSNIPIYLVVIGSGKWSECCHWNVSLNGIFVIVSQI